MKKLLLAPALMLAMTSAKAQLALENFNSPGMPAGWTMINDANKPHASYWTASVVTGLTSAAYMKWLESTGDSMLLSVSVFNPSAAADRWLITPSFMVTSPDMVISWFDQQLTALGGYDKIEVWVSTTGGATKADFTTKLGTGSPFDASTKKLVSLNAFLGMNVKVGFRSVAKDGGAFSMDDIQTELVALKTDGKNDGIDFPSIVSSTATNPVSMEISNNGTTAINSVQATYTLDGGTPVTQTFTSLGLLPGTSTVLMFTTGISGAALGAHTINTAIIQVNGAVDADATNNTKTFNFVGASKSVARSGLMEEFTSSTCSPCASFNTTFDPLIVSEKANEPASKFNIIKYQMNWPAPGNDPSYNAQGSARRTYYSVSGIPDHFTNGSIGGSGNKAEIDASKTAPAYMDIAATYTINKDSLIADVTITPYFTRNGTYKVQMASTEYHYNFPGAATSQKDYYHIMRNMAGSGNGIAVASWTDKTPQKFRWATKWTTGTVAQNSNTYWDHPSKGVNLVVFVQDEDDKAVLQSQSAPALLSAGIQNDNQLITQSAVYPNPAVDRTSIVFQLSASSTVGVQVTDMIGRTVYSIPEQKMNAGVQNFEIPTTSLSAGTYMIKVSSMEGTVAERFSVVK